MIYPINRNIHRPSHLYLDNALYFISARTKDRCNFFNDNIKKDMLKNKIDNAVGKYEAKLYSWVILPNHYHLLIAIKFGNDLAKIENLINGGSSHELNVYDKQSERKIWYQYWDYILRDESDFYVRFNYIHNNPIKHGCVKDFNELKDYNYCSYKDYLEKYGEKWLADCFKKYPITDFSITEDI